MRWDVYLANDTKHWVRIAVSKLNGRCTVSLNGERVTDRQGLKLMFDMDVKLGVSMSDHTATVLIRTPWFLRMKMCLEIDGERGVAA